MIEATCSACGTLNRIAEGDVPAGARYLTCSSCKARVMLPGAKVTTQIPKAAVMPAPPMPKAPPIPKAPGIKVPELADLPTPKRQSALSGAEPSKPAPKSGLDLADLPAPKSPVGRPVAPPLNLDDLLPADLLAPKAAAGISDLPAPKGKLPTPPARAPAVPAGIVDLPTPKSPAGLADLPTPKRATPAAPLPTVKPAAGADQDIVDLPAPKGGIVDLPTPKHGGSSVDLPAPKGFFDDLPQPAAASKQAKADLPAPKGFFDDLPQVAKQQGKSDLPAPKGFFDDLPQPSKAATPSLPAPKGFFDESPPPAATSKQPAKPPSKTAPPPVATAKGFFDDAPSSKPASGAGARGVFDDLPEPSHTELSGADLLGGAPLDLDQAPSSPNLDIGLAAGSAKSDFGDLDLSSPTAPPAIQSKTGITIKSGPGSGGPKMTSSGDGAALNAIPAQKLSGDLKLDLEDEPVRQAQAAVVKRDAPKRKAAEASVEDRAKSRKRMRVALGVVLGLALLGSGGAYAYKRYADKKQREADIAEHLQVARTAIHDGAPAHWMRASNEAGAVLEIDHANAEAVGLRAEALLAGALDTGVGGDGRIATGRKLLADALEQNITGPQLAAAKALGMIAANQPDRAVPALEAMVAGQPKNGFLLLYLGWAQVAKNDPTTALKSFDAAIAADPKVKLPALYARGKAKLQLVDLEGAKADFAAVLELAKDHIGAQVGLAASLPASQSSQREADLLAILARKDITTGDPRAVVQAWTLAGDVARAGGRLDVARERYRQALTLSKTDVPAHVGLARVELKDGKLAVAADQIQQALAQNAEAPDAMLVAAELYIKQGKLNDALAISQKLATRTPPLPPLQRANLQLVIGDIAEAQNRDEDAIEAWVEGAKLAGDLDLAPMMAAVTKLGGLAKKATDNHDDAKAAGYRARADQLLSSLADRAQEDAQLSKELGAAYLGGGDPVKAERFLRRAVDMRGTDIESRLELAKALAKLNRIDDALEQLREAQKLDPTRLDIALEIARTLEGAKRDDEATEAYAKLLASKDVTVQARVHAGRFFARKGDIKRGAEQADKILFTEPDNPAGHYLKGEGLMLANRLDEARKELTMAVDGDPDPQYLDAQGRAAEASATSTGDTKYYDLALRAYERAIAAEPEMFNPQAGTGRIYVARKEWTKALPPLLAANKLNSKDVDVMYNIGLAYKNVAQPGVAVDWFVAATKGRQDADTYWQLAQLYRDANRGAETAKTLHEATSLAADKENKTGAKVDWLTDAYYMLGQTEYDLHNAPAAKVAYERFIGRNPPPSERLNDARRLLNTELKSP